MSLPNWRGAWGGKQLLLTWMICMMCGWARKLILMQMKGVNCTWRVGRHPMKSQQQPQAAIQNSLQESSCQINSRLDNSLSPDLPIYFGSWENNNKKYWETPSSLSQKRNTAGHRLLGQWVSIGFRRHQPACNTDFEGDRRTVLFHNKGNIDQGLSLLLAEQRKKPQHFFSYCFWKHFRLALNLQ